MRTPSKNDYAVPVQGIGTFTFSRRTLADEIAIQVERSRILDGVEHPTDFLWNLAVWISAIRVLLVSAPAGWDLDAMDPLEPETFEQISRVFVEMRKKEDSFRRKPGAGGEGAGSGDREDNGLLVSEEVQPPAE